MPRVKSFHSIGVQRAYDLEVAHPDHQFYLANGLLTSNSHAISYAIDSYVCAYLLSYHEPEWLCAYIETQDGQDDKREKAISELRSFGYEIVRVDINHAGSSWTIMPGKKFMPALLTVKGVGQVAIDEIVANRPYKTVDELLFLPDGTWRHSKFNKRALENLIKVCAFDSMDIVGEGKYFRSYRHMWRVLIENNALLKKKKTARQTLARLVDELRDDSPEWDCDTLISQMKELIGSSDTSLVISHDARDWLENKLKVKSIDDFTVNGIYWFIADGLEQKTTKNGKSYMLITATGPSGKRNKVYCWGYDPKKHKLSSNTAYVAELSASEFGFATQAFKIRKAQERRREA